MTTRNLTEMNGRRAKMAVRKWAPLLEDTKKFCPIKNEQTKQATAMVLENQMRFLKEAATNSSIFGPQNGMTGGALNSTDSYASGDFRLPRIFIPMVRRYFPALMSNEVVGVQPMPGPVALGFALRFKYLKGALHQGDNGTRHFHTDNKDDEPHGKRGVEATIQIDGASDVAAKKTAYDETMASTTATAAEKTAAYTALEEAVKSNTFGELITVVAGQSAPVKQPFYTVEQIGGSAVDANGNPIWRASFTQLVKSLVYAKAPEGVTYTIPGTSVTVNHAEAVYATDETPKKAIEALENDAAAIIVKAVIASLDGKKIVGISFDDKAIDPATGNNGWGNAEMGWQRVDSRFSGRANAQLGAELAGGRWKFRPEDTGVAALMQQFEDTGAVAQTSFGFEKKAVEAGTRRLATSWTLETQEDLKNTNGINIEDEATQQMSFELQAEIDREMTVRMLYSALSNNEWSLWDGQLADARWMGERARAFYQNLVKRSARMQVRNRRGAANFIVCTPDVGALLEALDEFVVMPVSTSVSTANMASAKLGTIGRFSVYVDTRTAVYDGSDYGEGYDELFDPAGNKGGESEAKLPNYCMLGYKGTESWDAGILYCPYIPIMVQKAVDPYSFAPNVGLFTRYGVLDNIFGAHLYYHVIIIDSFSQPGIPTNLQKVYPAGAISASVASADDYPEGGYQYKYPVKTTEG